jgi:hypothetical protein
LLDNDLEEFYQNENQQYFSSRTKLEEYCDSKDKNTEERICPLFEQCLLIRQQSKS